MRSTACLFCFLLAFAAGPALPAPTAEQATLKAFQNEADIQAYLQPLQASIKAERERQRAEWEARRHTGNIAGSTTPGATVVVDNPATGFHREITADANGNYAMRNLPIGTYKVTAAGKTTDVAVQVGNASSASLDSVAVVGGSAISGTAPDSTDDITNVQTAGVDEGGLVKKAGDYLVVLRRGRLFSLFADGKIMRVVSTSNAYGPDVDGSSTWYDEMLVSGENVVVVGYSYDRGGTEIGLFHLAKDGQISYRATYHLSSYDYYSSRNYASRLAGNTLIFYSPIALFSSDAEAQFPGFRRWNPKAPNASFERISPAERIYRSGIDEDSEDQLLHTVTRCELTEAGMDCHGTSVIGPVASSFYVSRDAVYVWMTSGGEWHYAGSKDDEESSVVRIPLDDFAPTALRALGSPIDQMSFLEKDGFLNVLVGSEAKGERMWAAEFNSGRLALLRVPLSAFGDGKSAAAPENYRSFASGDDMWDLQNRYVGDWLLFGSSEERNSAWALRVDRNDKATKLDLPQTVERIEAMGSDALVVGAPRPFDWRRDRDSKRDLYLSSVSLGDVAQPALRIVLPQAEQEDDRTHGFFYRAQGEQRGLLGLPVVSGNEEASIRYFRNDRLRLSDVGGLAATSVREHEDEDDGCIASCYDWYGDARPIFIGERVYALIGYELIEGRLQGGQIREVRRLNFTPKAASAAP